MPLPYFNQNSNPFSINYQQEEKVELDLNNPIFVAYVDVKGTSRQHAEELFIELKKSYKNITVWVMASDENKIECVYDGQCRQRDMEISDLIKEINTRIDIMSKSNSFEDFKINIRDWRINELVNGSEKK